MSDKEDIFDRFCDALRDLRAYEREHEKAMEDYGPNDSMYGYSGYEDIGAAKRQAREALDEYIRVTIAAEKEK